ncbi:hypothetical protein GGQ64_000051 [Rhizobium azooxidifex]|uniref:Uncharacterized protein n=1 Tax=Mycoplana azooxidifex TaxID=1636188 RepID=A0A7W6D1C4_9HYPH|nr:hypothetical protein [Mycoplana azooxidifex]MBB3974875.1 hypothetical protein [Mycoplana azooxidifex]
MENTALEIAKLAVQALTPLAVGYIGWKVSKRLKDIDQHQWGNRKLSEKRIQIYDEISPLLNRLFCYFTYVGDWQHHTPNDIIITKRNLDHNVYVNRYLLEPNVFDSYQVFINALFQHYTGAGEDAKLKTRFGDRRSSPHFPWSDEWAHCFDTRDVAPLNVVHKLYEDVMKAQREGINA